MAEIKFCQIQDTNNNNYTVTDTVNQPMLCIGDTREKTNCSALDFQKILDNPLKYTGKKVSDEDIIKIYDLPCDYQTGYVKDITGIDKKYKFAEYNTANTTPTKVLQDYTMAQNVTKLPDGQMYSDGTFNMKLLGEKHQYIKSLFRQVFVKAKQANLLSSTTPLQASLQDIYKQK